MVDTINKEQLSGKQLSVFIDQASALGFAHEANYIMAHQRPVNAPKNTTWPEINGECRTLPKERILDYCTSLQGTRSDDLITNAEGKTVKYSSHLQTQLLSAFDNALKVAPSVAVTPRPEGGQAIA